MLGRLLALFLITPVVELVLLIQLGDLIGFLPTIALILVTGVVGSFLARREGLSAWRRFNERLQRGELPAKELIDGVIILMAGALLITPGVLTDVIGFIGLIPLSRHYLRRYFNRRLKRSMERGSVGLTFGGFEAFGGVYHPGGPPGTDPRAPEADTARDDRDEPWSGRGKQTPRYRDE